VLVNDVLPIAIYVTFPLKTFICKVLMILADRSEGVNRTKGGRCVFLSLSDLGKFFAHIMGGYPYQNGRKIRPFEKVRKSVRQDGLGMLHILLNTKLSTLINQNGSTKGFYFINVDKL